MSSAIGLLETTCDRPTREELRTLALEAGERFEEHIDDGVPAYQITEAVLRWTVEHFGAGIAVASSMANAVLPHVVSRHRPGVDVLFLDTGYHFAETLETRDRVAAEVEVNIIDVRPRLSVAQQDAEHGKDLFARDPSACCAMRKVEPLTQALQGYQAWVTGVRRTEAATRASAPLVTWDEGFDLVKVNPLVIWSDADMVTYAELHSLPGNPLLERGYPSIGCAPCTRPVAPGADPRSGRWVGFAKTECGLHPGDDGGQR